MTVLLAIADIECGVVPRSTSITAIVSSEIAF